MLLIFRELRIPEGKQASKQLRCAQCHHLHIQALELCETFRALYAYPGTHAKATHKCCQDRVLLGPQVCKPQSTEDVIRPEASSAQCTAHQWL